jgi:hypothetical protein
VHTATITASLICCLALPGVATAAGEREDALSGARMARDVATIASFGPRPAGSAAERRTASFLGARLRRLGYSVRRQGVPLPGGGSSVNLIAIGAPRPIALASAHIDGVRGSRAANDNASGAAALLELARRLRGSRVMIVGFGAEERVVTGSRVHVGSAHFANRAPAAQLARIRVAVNLDMIGSRDVLRVRWLGGPVNRSARLALAEARRAGIPARAQADRRGLSDHLELTRAGVPTAWLYRPDSCWHRACDRPTRISRRSMAQAVRVADGVLRRAPGLRRLPFAPQR